MIKLNSLQERMNSDGIKQYFYIAKRQNDRTGDPVYAVYTSPSLDYQNGIYLFYDGSREYWSGGELYGTFATQADASKAITAYGKKHN